MRILTCDEVREAERESISQPGMSTLVLMERAGAAIVRFCLSRFQFASVTVICGKGNNGGDGLVAAELLRQAGKDVSVVILAADVSALSPDAAVMCARLRLQPIWVSDEDNFQAEDVREALKADLILDAIVGTGFKPPLRGLAAKAVDALQAATQTVVAVDLPSGIDADRATPLQDQEQVVRCQGIVTFIAPKPAHIFGNLTSGGIAVSDLGVSVPPSKNQEEMQAITGWDVGTAFPRRPRAANKGQFGHVLIVAGSKGKAGAAGLAGMAALRSGAGLVTIASPSSVQPTIAGFAPELMTEALPETEQGTISPIAGERVEALLVDKDAVVVGPGLSRNAETETFIRKLATHCPLPMVLDADGLNAFEGRSGELKNASGFRVLTPHPGEAARLIGASIHEVQKDRIGMARRIMRDTGCCVVLKGANTVIAGLSGQTWINMTGNPSMAKGGSGDVLSGIVAAALARRAVRRDLPQNHSANGAPLQDSRVAAAVYLHGLAGDLAEERLHENAVLATGLVSQLAGAFRDCDEQVKESFFFLQH
jgi:ADP-dependent NAD(P)H-hydrate dehydratase / NAD(P)H-hydrate epimerase